MNLERAAKCLPVALMMALASAQAATQPASRPATRPESTSENRPGDRQLGRLFEPYRNLIHSLDLTPQQETEVQGILEKLTEQLRTAAQDLREMPPEERRTKIRDIMTTTNQAIIAQLTETQRAKFQQGLLDLAQNNRNIPFPPASTPSTRPAAPAVHPTTSRTEPDESGIGKPAPDLSLQKLDGTPVKLSAYHGRNLVLIFGSYTSPTFRDKAPALNELLQDYRNKAEFLIVYTAEAFPAGKHEIDRNRDAKIAIPPHTSEADRITAAKNAKTALKLTGTLVIDTLNDATASAYHALPNGAVIIGKDGTLLARQRWFEPFALRRLIDEATKPSTRPFSLP